MKLEGQSSFETIPPSLVIDAAGKQVSWPHPVQGSQSQPLYFDAAHASTKMQQEGGKVEIRALFDGPYKPAGPGGPGSGTGYSTPVTAKVDRFLGNVRDASVAIGPGTLDLLTGNLGVTRTDVSIPGSSSALEFSRHHNSRDANAAGVLGPGWAPNMQVEAAGGAAWRSFRDVTITEEFEEEKETYSYGVLTDLEGNEYNFEKNGGDYVTPPEAAGWELSSEGANRRVLADADGNRTIFESNGGNEYLPISVSSWAAARTRPGCSTTWSGSAAD